MSLQFWSYLVKMALVFAHASIEIFVQETHRESKVYAIDIYSLMCKDLMYFRSPVTPVKTALEKSTPCKFAPEKSAPWKVQSSTEALDKFAPRKSE